ncbi:MAG TPA: hypothetical protein VKA84_20640 [Gemmatimonadaceae bacterium]|nr:hypothetical protein [Gemmatimonadaceae bacterium]
MPKSFVRSSRPRAMRVWAALLGVAALAACSDASPLAPSSSGAPALSQVAVSGASSDGLLSCPSTMSFSASRVIGARGGLVKVGGATLRIPAGAVLAPTEFTVTVPASQYLEVDMRAAGQEHYTFARPVEVQLSYRRCTRKNESLALGAWYIDTQSKSMLEWMGGAEDRPNRTVTFETTHLSGYALAYRNGNAEGHENGEGNAQE